MCEIECNVVFNEYKDCEGQVFNVQVVCSDNKGNWFVEFGVGEVILFFCEQIFGEKLIFGGCVKIYFKEVCKIFKGLIILVLCVDERLFDYLFKQEIFEVVNGIVEVKVIVCEVGQCFKVVVFLYNFNVDFIGVCIGYCGNCIQVVIGEFGCEWVDVILWDVNICEFICNVFLFVKVGFIEVQ